MAKKVKTSEEKSGDEIHAKVTKNCTVAFKFSEV